MFARGSQKLIASIALLLTAPVAIATQPAAPADEAPAANPRNGEALYVGEKAFANGGAPCLACHGVAGHGLARAASFGPDLTATFEAYGAETLDGVLAEVPFPSMQPIYNTHALTPSERADVVAFLGEAGGKVPSKLGGGFAGAIAAAFVALGAAFVFVGRGRSRRRGSPSPLTSSRS
jgi:mono/diheme cytochrome c family protein